MYTVVKKEYIEELEKDTLSAQKDKIHSEKKLKAKLDRILEAFLYIKEKRLGKTEILEIIDTLLEEEFNYESDQ